VEEGKNKVRRKKIIWEEEKNSGTPQKKMRGM